jgi:hypothetical protein
MIDRDNVIRMAREAGAAPYTNRHYPERPTHTFTVEQLKRFVAMVAEDCAKVADQAEPYQAADKIRERWKA